MASHNFWTILSNQNSFFLRFLGFCWTKHTFPIPFALAKQSWAYLNNGYSTAFWYSKSFTRKRLMTVFGGAWVEHLWTLSIITPWLECLITTRLDLCYHKTLYCTRFGTIWPMDGAIISNCVLLADKSWTHEVMVMKSWCSTKIITHYTFLAQGTSTFVTQLLLWWTLMLPFWIFS